MTIDRAKHSLAVAKAMYLICEHLLRFDKATSRKAFVIGFNHDIGYGDKEAVSTTHQEVGSEMLYSFSPELAMLVRDHGKPNVMYPTLSYGKWLFLLDLADNSITGDGSPVSYQSRVKDIAKRYANKPEVLEYTNKVHKNMEWYAENYLKENDQHLYKVWTMFNDNSLANFLTKTWNEV